MKTFSFRAAVVCVAGAAVLHAHRAHAQDISLGTGPFLLVSPTSICQTSLGTEGCTNPTFRGLEVLSAASLGGRASAGLSGAVGWSPEVTLDVHHRIFAALLFGRYRLTEYGVFNVLGTAKAGWVGIEEAEERANRSRAQLRHGVWGGLSLSSEAKLSRAVGLSLEVGMPLLAFPSSPAPISDTASGADYRSRLWLYVGLSLQVAL